MGDKLTNVAKVRLALATAATCLNSVLLTPDARDENELLEALEGVVKLHPLKDSMKKFIVRFLATRFRRDAVLEWRKSERYLDLLPDPIRAAVVKAKPDLFLIRGEDYANIRNQI